MPEPSLPCRSPPVAVSQPVRCYAAACPLPCCSPPVVVPRKEDSADPEERESGISLLGYPDSNQERQDQNLQCYHYTIAQSVCSSLLRHLAALAVADNRALGYPDSNQERQDQNLQCYHYTIAQCCRTSIEVCGCKFTAFLRTDKSLCQKNIIYLRISASICTFAVHNGR